MTWEPCGHRQPLPRIETQPKRQEPPQLVPEHLRIQIEHMEKMMRLKEAERVWQHVVDMGA